MSNQPAASQSQNSVVPKGSNGEDKTPPTLEPETQPPYPPQKYVLEDFSQQRINRGQQEINYLITIANKRIVNALNQVSTALAKLASNGCVDLGALDNAIKAASAANDKIAGEFPPGCGDGPRREE